MGKKSLFCYGTLQSPLVMKSVTGSAFSGEEAILNGWARYRVQKSEYPGIRQEEGGAVSGKLYWDMDEQAIEKLDAFEGDKYQRVCVTVELPDGKQQEAWAYSFKEDFQHLLSNDPWELNRFMQNGLERFINWFVEDRRDFFDRGDL